MKGQSVEQPKYVLRFNEAVLVAKESKIITIRRSIWVIAAIIIIASFIFRENMLRELSWPVRVILFSLCIGTLFIPGRERKPFPMEVRFYDSYLVVYREKYVYSKRLSRKMIDKFMYSDIHEIMFRKRAQRINIYGVVEGIWYNYNRDGTLPEAPTYHKTTDSISYFYTMFAQDVDFVKEFERHCPVKVTISDT